MLDKNGGVNSATKLEYLAQLKFFRNLTQRDLQELSSVATLGKVQKGHIFYRPEEMSEMVFLLQKGYVHLYRISSEGKKLIITTVGPNMLFDDIALLPNSSHQSFAEAAEACEFLVLERSKLMHVMLKYPQTILRIYDNISNRLHHAEAKMESFAFRTIAERLSKLLLDLSQEQGGSKITGLTHQVLAEYLGTYRETTTQVLNTLQSQGYIDIGRKRIDILSAERLAAVVYAG